MKKHSNYYYFLILIILMSILPLISTDIYLPAFPDVSHYFHADFTQVQQTLGIYLFSIAIMQLIYGPLSDIYGRKKILLSGVVIYIIGTLGCLLSFSISQMLIGRLLQGLGICAGIVISKAIISDTYDAKESAKIYTTVFPFIGCSPAIAPVIGGYLTSMYSWQANFIFLLFLAVLLFIGSTRFLKETKKFDQPSSFSLTQIFKNYGSLITSRLFMGYTLVVCCAYGAWFSYISDSSFIFKTMGFESHQIGYFYVPLSVTYVITNLIGKRLIGKIKIDHLILSGILILLSGSVLMVIFTQHPINNPLSIIVPMSIIAAGNGFLLPLGTSSGLSRNSKISGTASGFLGFLQLGTAALCATLVGHFTNGSAFHLALFITGIGIVLLTSYIYLIVWPRKLDEIPT